MRKSKVHMPEELEKKCHVAIHSAAVASATAGAVPIPFADAVPITAAQIGMVLALGKIFDMTITDATAKSLAGLTLTQQVGRSVAANFLKMIPGAGIFIGGTIKAATAASLTETFGWIIANDFYKMSQGEEPDCIMEAAGELKGAFEGLRFPET